MTPSSQLSAAFLEKQAGGLLSTVGNVVKSLGHTVTNPIGSLAHGTGSMLREAGHLPGVADGLIGFGKRIEGLGQSGADWAAKLPWAARMGMGLGGLATGAVAFNAMPWLDPAYQIGNNVGANAGTMLALRGGRGHDEAMRGASGNLAGFYDALSNASYADRRRILNNPSMLGGNSEQMLGNPPRMGFLSLLKDLGPWGSGNYVNDLATRKAFGAMQDNPFLKASRYKQAGGFLSTLFGAGEAALKSRAAMTGLAEGAGNLAAKGNSLFSNLHPYIKYPLKGVNYTLNPFSGGLAAMAVGGGLLGGWMNAGPHARMLGSAVSTNQLSNQLSAMPWWQREMVAADPSVAMEYMEKLHPGTIAGYEKLTGHQFKPGMLGEAFSGNSTGNTPMLNFASGGVQTLT